MHLRCGGVRHGWRGLYRRRSGRCSALDFLLPVEVPVRNHAALRLRRAYRAVAHLPVFEVLKLVFLMEARRGCRGLQP